MGFLPESQLQSKKEATDTPKCGGACKRDRKCDNPYTKMRGKGSISVLFVLDSAPKPDAPETKRLASLSSRAGLPIGACKVTHAVRCYSPLGTEDCEVDACGVFMRKDIAEFNPTVIIPMGVDALRSIILPEWNNKIDGFSRWVKYQIPSRLYNAWICPTYSIKWALERDDEVLWDIIVRHLELAAEKVDKRPEVKWEPREEVTILDDPEDICKRLRMYRRGGGTIAFDYETTGLKPDAATAQIVSNSVCWNGRETIAYMMDDPAVIMDTTRLLASDSTAKIASNMKFEERWTRAKLGIPVANWAWDTMLASHIQDCRRGVNSIKFQTYVRFGIGDYDSHIHKYLVADGSNELNRIRELDKNDLLLYNGLDSLLEYRVAVEQMREMGLPWAGDKPEKIRKNRRKRSL